MQIKSLRLSQLVLSLSLSVAFAAAAAPPVGVVKRVDGTVQLQRGGSSQAAVVGQALEVGDVLRTSRDGAVAVTLADDTLLAAGPGSELVITNFSFDPTTQQGGMLLSLWRGVMSVVTGLVAKRTPENVNVQTRTVVLGVRGTEFIIDAGEER